MRKGLFAIIATAALPALASQPGHPLDCSDWVFLDSAYRCSDYSRPCVGGACEMIGQTRVVDNAGGIVYLTEIDLGTCEGCSGTPGRIRKELHRFDGTTDELIAYIEGRCGGNGTESPGRTTALMFDAINGRL